MRNRGYVLDSADFDPGSLQSADRRLAAGSRSADPDFDAAHTVVARHVGGVHRRLLRSKRRAFSRTAEPERARTLPGENIAGLVRDGHDRVVEGSLNMHDSERDMLALLLLERFLLAFLLRCRCTGCCCGLCHENRPQFWVVGKTVADDHPANLNISPESSFFRGADNFSKETTTDGQRPATIRFSPSISSSPRLFPCAGPCGYGRWYGCAGREPEGCGGGGIRDRNRFR